MKLLLTSAGLTNDAIKKALTDLAGKNFPDLNLLFVPTAAEVEKGDKKWMVDDLNNCVNAGFGFVDILDFTAVPKDVWLPRFERADVILFGGGNTFHLIYSMQKHGLDKELPKLLESRVYVGISAGCMVTAKNINLSDSPLFYSEEIGELPVRGGLGFVDFQMRPHFNSPHFPKLTEGNLRERVKDIGDTVYAIDDNTAIKVEDGKIEVISQGKWVKFN